ncbi:MAG: membrane protein insertase YidC [Desulfatibacillum sp.]|nr:membrane protein insertase YidC [Desulfatibacillum sp.]
MDNLRLTLAIVLSMVVFFLYQYFFVPRPDVNLPGEAQQIEEVQAASVPSAEPVSSSAPPAPASTFTPALEQASVRAAREIMVDTPLYRAIFTEQGAGLVSLTLKKYREAQNKDSQPKQVVNLPPGIGTLLTTMEKGSLGNLESAVFHARDIDNISVQDQARSLVFTWTAPSGVLVEKTYTFHPETYVMDCQFSLANNTVNPINDRLSVILANTIPTDKSSSIVFNGPVALVNHSLDEIKVTEKKPLNTQEGVTGWIGLTWRYFMSAVVFEEAREGNVRATLDPVDNVVQTRFTGQAVVVSPGQTFTSTHKAFFGPKESHVLDQAGLGKALHFGFFHVIAKPCLWLMNQMYRFIPNYGIAIILLTLLIKIAFWPLGNKSYRSMEKMKKLQPLMTELREKYKDDKQRMNQEVFALYKTFKVNPMSGCLPMVIQIPVFIGLYKMLYSAIELRHSPFFGWITDLSAPDRLFHLPFAVPFMAEPYGIPVLTLIMGASMLLQQKMSPPPGDPTQAKMMMLLPLVFLFIFINFPSGLVLYWLVNNVISIAQQYYIGKTSS